MAGTIRYGTAVFHEPSDEALGYYRLLIQRIVGAGKTEWLPMTGRDERGNEITSDILITPGIPIMITTETSEGAGDVLTSLVDEYINLPLAEAKRPEA